MRAWATRWRVALRIARRDALRHKGRTVMVVLLMMLPVLAGTVIVGVLRSSEPTAGTEASWLLGSRAQARLAVSCDGFGQPTKQQAGRGDIQPNCGNAERQFGANVEDRIAEFLPEGADLSEARSGRFNLRTEDSLVSSQLTLAADPAQIPGLFGQVRGSETPQAGEVVLSELTAASLQVEIGSTIELVDGDENVALRVVGIGEYNRHLQALVGPDSLPDGAGERIWFVTGDEPVTWADVEKLNTLGIRVSSRAVMLDPPPTGQVYGGAFAQNMTNLPAMGTLAGVLAIGLIEVILLIGPAFAVGAKRTARQLALVAASGGRPTDLRRIVLAGGLVTGLAAGVLGALLGTGIALGIYAVMDTQHMPVPNVVIPGAETVGIALVAAVLGLAAAWLPARRAAKADVVLVLAGRRAEPTVKRRMAWIGLSLAALGVVGALVAAATESVIVLVVALVAIEVGLVLAAGAVVSLANRLAPRLRVAGRFALRDAARNRSRTAPAVAAVLAAVAAATAGMVMVASSDQADQARVKPVAADGVAFFTLPTFDTKASVTDATYREAAESIETELSGVQVQPIQHLQHSPQQGDAPYLQPLVDPAQECPEGSPRGPDAADERCRGYERFSGYSIGMGNLVDDGTVVSMFDLPGAEHAAQALANGHVLVNDPRLIWPDGEVHLTFSDEQAESLIEPITVPAELVEWGHFEYHLVFPPEVADQLLTASDSLTEGEDEDDALALRTVAGVIDSSGALSPAQESQVRSLLADAGSGVSLHVAGTGREQGSNLALLVILGAAVLVALFATGLSVGLAIVESRADLATLSAVGASPRVRRKVRSAQAGVIAVIGTMVGVGTGLLLAVVLGRWQVAYMYDASIWELVVPWQYIAALALGLPLLAIVGGWLLTRSRMPIPQRAAT